MFVCLFVVLLLHSTHVCVCLWVFTRMARTYASVNGFHRSSLYYVLSCTFLCFTYTQLCALPSGGAESSCVPSSVPRPAQRAMDRLACCWPLGARSVAACVFKARVAVTAATAVLCHCSEVLWTLQALTATVDVPVAQCLLQAVGTLVRAHVGRVFVECGRLHAAKCRLFLFPPPQSPGKGLDNCVMCHGAICAMDYLCLGTVCALGLSAP